MGRAREGPTSKLRNRPCNHSRKASSVNTEKTLKSHLLDHPGQVKNSNISGSLTNFLAKEEGISYLKEAGNSTPSLEAGFSLTH